MTIAPADAVIVNITARNGSFKYDGTQKDLSGYDVEISNSLYKETDFTFNGNSDLKGVNAGTYRTEMNAGDFVNENENFGNVFFTIENGTLEITKRDITLTSGNAEKPYDGTPLTNNEIAETGEGFAEGEGVNITVTGRITAEGEADNTFTYSMTGRTLASNYNITPVYGKLKVTPSEGELAEHHKLTITYQYEDGTVIRIFTNDYMEGSSYSVTSEKISGYTADAQAVRGVMGTADINETVTYIASEYTLTVRFVSVTDGKEVTAPVTMQLRSGDNFTVFIPAVEGYGLLSDKDRVTGNMPDSDRTITVYLLAEGDEATLGLGTGGTLSPIEIDDFGTPLGIADSILGGGEVIE